MTGFYHTIKFLINKVVCPKTVEVIKELPENYIMNNYPSLISLNRVIAPNINGIKNYSGNESLMKKELRKTLENHNILYIPPQEFEKISKELKEAFTDTNINIIQNISADHFILPTTEEITYSKSERTIRTLKNLF